MRKKRSRNKGEENREEEEEERGGGGGVGKLTVLKTKATQVIFTPPTGVTGPTATRLPQVFITVATPLRGRSYLSYFSLPT